MLFSCFVCLKYKGPLMEMTKVILVQRVKLVHYFYQFYQFKKQKASCNECKRFGRLASLFKRFLLVMKNFFKKTSRQKIGIGMIHFILDDFKQPIYAKISKNNEKFLFIYFSCSGRKLIFPHSSLIYSVLRRFSEI